MMSDSDSDAARHRRYTARWSVRIYEMDANGHVNNAVYLNWAEQLATEHAASVGFGPDWTSAHGGTWVVRKHEIEYRRAARFGDVLELTTEVQLMRGARGQRRTTIRREADGETIAEVLTEWVWLRADGRPGRIPAEIVDALGDAPA